MKKIVVSLVTVCLALGCVATLLITQNKQSYDFSTEVELDNLNHSYSVSTSNDLATAVGMSVLESGGNAVDAAIAISYTLSVVEPYASGLGGSGGMLVYNMSDTSCYLYDYRASSGASPYLVDNVQIPGFVKGMEKVHEDYGTIPMEDLIQPAVDYAQNGFNVDEELVRAMSYVSIADAPFYNADSKLLSVDDVMKQEDLAETLKLIQNKGSDVFYNGEIAEDITSKCALTMEDLGNYKVYKREAVKESINGYSIYSAGAPFSGITLIQMLKMASMDSISDPRIDATEYLNNVNGYVNATYSSRYREITDPSLYSLDESSLVSDEYVKSLIGSGSSDYENIEGTETTSFSVVDSNGLVISCTNTLSDFWGSQVIVDGIFLNDTGTNYSESGVNRYEPNKRSRTFTAPTILVNDKDIYSIGTPGGSDVPQFLFQVILDIIQFNVDPQEAVNSSRVLFRNGILYLESEENYENRVDSSQIAQDIVWVRSGSSWGCISLAGYKENEAWAVYDFRRTATYAGAKN